MADRQAELLARALGGELDPAQQRQFDDLVAQDGAFRAQWQQAQRVRERLAEAPAGAFQPFFATRVMARLDAERRGAQPESLAVDLVAWFRSLAPAALALCLGLVVLNLRDGDLMGEDAGWLDQALALPAADLEVAELLDL